MKGNNRQLSKGITISLIFLWIIFQYLLLHHFGIIEKDEAKKYIDEANLLLNGQSFSAPKYIFYSVYIFLVAAMKAIGAGTTGVYLFQLLLNGIGLVVFFHLARLISKDILTAHIAVFLLIICIPFQAWTTHLYTESVFTSLLIVFMYSYVRYGLLHFCTLASILLIIFTRPTGIVLIPALLTKELFFKPGILKKSSIAVFIPVILIITGFILTINYSMKGKGDFNFLLPFTEGFVICDVPQMKAIPALNIPQDTNSLQGLIVFMFQNPVYFFKMGILKLIAFFGMVRPYYSASHNFMLALFFYPLYIAGIAGLYIQWVTDKYVTAFFLLIIAAFTGVVIFTCDDWLNRFVLPLIPIIILYSSIGIRPLIRKYGKF